MAKRNTSRPQDPDNPEPAPRRKATRPRAARAAEPEELPRIEDPGDVADQAQRSESIVTEPTEDEIRRRAYQRYLERGAGHGRDFDDWLQAERELKGKA